LPAFFFEDRPCVHTAGRSQLGQRAITHFGEISFTQNSHLNINPRIRIAASAFSLSRVVVGVLTGAKLWRYLQT
jgi:hypothetical protein